MIPPSFNVWLSARARVQSQIRTHSVLRGGGDPVMVEAMIHALRERFTREWIINERISRGCR